jgi:hypothetical protein
MTSNGRLVSPTNPSAHEIIDSAKRHTPNQRRTFSGIQRLFTTKAKRKKHSAYRPTYDKVDNGPACRIYGSVDVKKVTANLHITTLGHGYMSYEHTDHGRGSRDFARADSSHESFACCSRVFLWTFLSGHLATTGYECRDHDET